MVISPADISIGERATYDGIEPIYGPLPDGAGREPTVCAADGRRNSVIVVAGQSNAANFAAGRYRPRGDVLNFSLYDGQFYQAVDPLIGASGDGGNFATRLGDVLIDRGFSERVVLAPVSMGNTRIEDWSSGGAFNRRILVLIRRLYEAGVTPDLILWQQGEGNAHEADVGGLNYRRHLFEVVQTFRGYGISAPFGIALCTLCGDPLPTAEHVRAGQRAAVSREFGTFLGPDTDTILHEHRFDRCHMSEDGAQKQAEMWADTIMGRGQAE